MKFPIKGAIMTACGYSRAFPSVSSLHMRKSSEPIQFSRNCERVRHGAMPGEQCRIAVHCPGSIQASRAWSASGEAGLFMAQEAEEENEAD